MLKPFLSNSPLNRTFRQGSRVHQWLTAHIPPSLKMVSAGLADLLCRTKFAERCGEARWPKPEKVRGLESRADPRRSVNRREPAELLHPPKIHGSVFLSFAAFFFLHYISFANYEHFCHCFLVSRQQFFNVNWASKWTPFFVAVCCPGTRLTNYQLCLLYRDALEFFQLKTGLFTLHCKNFFTVQQ